MIFAVMRFSYEKKKGRNNMASEISKDEILTNLFEGVYFVDKNREISTWNKGAEQITGFSANEVVKRRCYDNILNHVDENGIALCFQGCPLQATMNDGKAREADVYLQHKKGYRVPVTVRAIPLYNDEKELVGAMEFFSENKNDKILLNKIEQYRKESNEDSLTKLSNRRYLEAIIESKIREFRTVDIPFGIAFFDIDDFKKVNDTYGHDAGDEVLKIIAKTAQINLRNNDFIARWGGEEFVIVFSSLDQSGISVVSEKVRHLIESSEIRSNESKIHVSVSIGSTISIETDTVESIIKRADELMYISKINGKNRVTIG